MSGIAADGTSDEFAWSEDEVLAELRELSALLGPAHCINARQLAMRPEFFPDAWSRDLGSMRRLLQRLLAHAGLPDADLDVELQDARSGVEELGTHLATNLYFGGWIEGRPRFAVATLGDPRATIGPACVEVGRAVLHKRRLDASATNYRSDEPEAELPTRHEGFLAAALLGWGVLVTNASFDPRSVGRNIGYDAENAWIESTVEVEPELAVWVLAVLWRARPDRALWHDELAKELNPSQRQAFDHEFTELAGQERELLAELGWSAGDAERGPSYDGLRNIDVGEDASESDALQTRGLRNQGKPVFRVRRRRTLGLSLVGMFAGTLGAGIAQSLIVLPLVFAAITLVGYLWRTSYCADPSCHEVIDPTAKSCPGCGGFVAGDIDKDSKRLDALEAYEDKQRKAQEAA